MQSQFLSTLAVPKHAFFEEVLGNIAAADFNNILGNGYFDLLGLVSLHEE